MCRLPSNSECPYLVTPQHGVRLLALRFVPYLQQLLLGTSTSARNETFKRHSLIRMRVSSHLYAPFSHQVGVLLGIWPIQRRAQGPYSRNMVSIVHSKCMEDHLSSDTYNKPIVAQAQLYWLAYSQRTNFPPSRKQLLRSLAWSWDTDDIRV